MTQALLASLLLLATAAVDVPPPGGETLAAARDASARMTLPAQINGHGPFAFTIDTGADRSVVSDSLAAELALPSAGAAMLIGIVGPQPVPTVTLDRLRIGHRERRGIAAPVLPRGALGASGFIGLDALAGESVLLDFRRNRISIARSPEEAMVDDPEVIVVTGKSRFGQLILTDARVGGTKIYAIIDTGAQNTIGNLAFRALMGRSGPLRDGGNRIVGVTGAELPAEAGTVPRIRLGGMTLVDMPVAYADIQTFHRFGVGEKPAILLGMDVLRGFERVAVDFRRRTVRFRVGDGPLKNAAAAPARHGTTVPLAL